jgi:predicted nucleic acid-binding protein
MDSFDADVLIYAAAVDHPLRLPVRRLLQSDEDRVGSELLVPEVLAKPMRTGASAELEELVVLLGRLTLLPCDLATAQLAGVLGASYGLRAVDAVNLATAVHAGADRFVTDNRRDIPDSVEEIEVVYADRL